MKISDTTPEIMFLADLLVKKVWQGDPSRYGLAKQAASVAVAGLQDFHWKMTMQGGTGESSSP